MSRNSSFVNGVSKAQQKIAQLHYEKANIRLWKEKDAADADAAIQQLKQREENVLAELDSARQLSTELTRREQALTAQINSIRHSLSWRVTGPLRRVASVIRSIRKPAFKPPSNSDVVKDEKPASPVFSPAIAKGDSVIVEPEGPGEEAARVTGSEVSTFSPSSAACLDEDEKVYIKRGRPAWDCYGKEQLRQFHSRNKNIIFPVVDSPSISIVIVSYNNPQLLLLCLSSIEKYADTSYEVIIVDNHSDTETLELLDRVRGAQILKNGQNCGFPKACMQGVARAAGTYLCFLNNDALLGKACLSTALRVFADDKNAGAVGARILQPDGLLQEAGAIIWCDGTTNGYGAADDPMQLRYLFRRPVDYCSGAFLVTPRSLFDDMGGFDEGFSPGYYEDADYCMRLWSDQRSVIYEPNCIVHHYGNAGSRHKGDTLSIVIKNHERFYHRWASDLSRHCEPYGDNTNAARFATASRSARVLFIAEEVPHATDGHEWTVLNELLKLGHVTCATIRKPPEEGDYVDIDRRVELMDATEDPTAAIRRIAPEYGLFRLSKETTLSAFRSAVRDLNNLVAEVELDLPVGVQSFTFDEFLRTFVKE